jgi:hypothetical protein
VGAPDRWAGSAELPNEALERARAERVSQPAHEHPGDWLTPSGARTWPLGTRRQVCFTMSYGICHTAYLQGSVSAQVCCLLISRAGNLFEKVLLPRPVFHCLDPVHDLCQDLHARVGGTQVLSLNLLERTTQSHTNQHLLATVRLLLPHSRGGNVCRSESSCSWVGGTSARFTAIPAAAPAGPMVKTKTTAPPTKPTTPHVRKDMYMKAT